MNKSRKLFLLYVVLILATVGAFAPPLVVWLCQVFGKNVPPFSILGSTEWVSMISLVVTTYFGSNVWEKHVALSNGVMPESMNSANTQVDASGVFGQKANARNMGNQDSVQQNTDADKEALKDQLKHGN